MLSLRCLLVMNVGSSLQARCSHAGLPTMGCLCNGSRESPPPLQQNLLEALTQLGRVCSPLGLSFLIA